MAEIIDIRGRLGRGAPVESAEEGRGSIFRVRLCGPDLRWIGLVGGILADALTAEGFWTAFEDMGTPCGGPPLLSMRAGRQFISETGSEQTPSLVVAGTFPPDAALQGSDSRTVLLAQEGNPADDEGRAPFPGVEVTLPLADPAPEPLGIAVACAGGAARLLGVIRWRVMVQVLREELTLSDGRSVGRHVATAFEAYRRLAQWKGVVPEVESS